MKEVKKPKKPLIFYYGIVMLALLLVNLFIMPWMARRQIQEVDYGTFMTMTENGELGKVEIESNQILFTDKDESQIYKTGPIEDPGLVERLHAAGVTFSSEIVEQAYVEPMSDAEKAQTYVKIMSIPSQEQMDAAVAQAMEGTTREDMQETMTQALTAQMGMDEAQVQDYVTAMSDEEMTELFSQMAAEQVRAQYAAQVQAQLEGMDLAQLAAMLDAEMENYSTQQCAAYYDEILEFSDSTYDANLQQLGYIDLDKPSAINLYASSFENKDVIEQAITDYNDQVEELQQIRYTDYVGLMMSSVTTIINAITYVLIAFVAISLIVSSIMIGVITLISVQERTKEIGILRAIGASKRNVSRLFNAETVIIGFTSGVLGIAVTYLLCIPINALLHHLTGISNLSAQLPVPVALILVGISMALTLISGIIPSRSAAKKDPVVALRTE